MIIALKDGIIGIMLDLKNPKLDWDTEMQAVKQNVNLLVYIATTLIDVILTIIVSVLGTTFIMAAVYVLILQIIELIIISCILKKKETTLLKEII
jgi:ABC-2 type transport system permease protein